MSRPSIGIRLLKSRQATAALLLCAAAWLTTAAGCGSSAYAEKFQQRFDQLKTSSAFSEVLYESPTEGLPMNFRIPKGFTKAYDQVSADSENGGRRIFSLKFAPAFLPNFPGLLRMYEGEAASGKDLTAPYYLYIGAGDAAAVKGKFPYEEWTARIKRGRMNPGAWEDVEVPTPKGDSAPKLKWKRLTATGKYAWDITKLKAATPTHSSVDTSFQMWVYETPQTIAILGWWSTEETKRAIDLEKLAKLTAGTAVASPIAATHAPAPAPSAPVKAK